MNEDLLKVIYDKEGFANKGIGFDEFKTDIQDSNFQRLIFDKSFSKKGIQFTEFQSDLGFGPAKAPQPPKEEPVAKPQPKTSFAGTTIDFETGTVTNDVEEVKKISDKMKADSAVDVQEVSPGVKQTINWQDGTFNQEIVDKERHLANVDFWKTMGQNQAEKERYREQSAQYGFSDSMERKFGYSQLPAQPEYQTPDDPYFKVKEKLKSVDKIVEEETPGFLESFGSSLYGATLDLVSYLGDFGAPITSPLITGTAAALKGNLNTNVSTKKQNIDKKVNEERAKVFESLSEDELQAADYKKVLAYEASTSDTKEEAIRKANFKMSEHANTLATASNYFYDKLTPEEKDVVGKIENGEPVDPNNISENLSKWIKVNDSAYAQQKQLKENVGRYADISKFVSERIGEYKNSGLEDEEIQDKILADLQVFRDENPNMADEIEDAENIIKDRAITDGDMGGAAASILLNTWNNVADSVDAFYKTNKAAHGYSQNIFNITRGDLEDVNKENFEKQLRDVLVAPSSEYTGSIRQTQLKKGGRVLVIEDGKVVDIRREDGTKVFNPSKEDISLAESYNPNVDGYGETNYNLLPFAYQGLQIVSDMVPMIAATAAVTYATGGTGTAATIGAMLGSMTTSYGSYYEEALEKTGDMKKAAAYAAIIAPSIGFVESKIGPLEGKLARTISGTERAAIRKTIMEATEEASSRGIESYVKGRGILTLIKDKIRRSPELASDLKGELFEEFSNFPVEAIGAAVSGVRSEPITEDEIKDTFQLTALVSGVLGGGKIMIDNASDINDMLGYAATRTQKFEEIGEKWINDASTDEEKAKRQKDFNAKKVAVNEVKDTFNYVNEGEFTEEQKDTLIDLSLRKAKELYKLNTSESDKSKKNIQGKIADLDAKIGAIIPGGVPTSAQPEAEQPTPEATQPELDVEAQRADIERRRKEELDFYGEDRLSEDYSMGSSQTIGEAVNAKYDAELEALEKKVKEAEAKQAPVLAPEAQAEVDDIDKKSNALQAILDRDDELVAAGAESIIGDEKKKSIQEQLDNLKTRKDAIQKQGAAEVSVQPEPKVGEEVGGQVQPEPEGAAGEGQAAGETEVKAKEEVKPTTLPAKGAAPAAPAAATPVVVEAPAITTTTTTEAAPRTKEQAAQELKDRATELDSNNLQGFSLKNPKGGNVSARNYSRNPETKTWTYTSVKSDGTLGNTIEVTEQDKIKQLNEEAKRRENEREALRKEAGIKPDFARPLTKEEGTLNRKGGKVKQAEAIKRASLKRMSGGKELPSQFEQAILEGDITPEDAIAAMESADIAIPPRILELKEQQPQVEGEVVEATSTNTTFRKSKDRNKALQGVQEVYIKGTKQVIGEIVYDPETKMWIDNTSPKGTKKSERALGDTKSQAINKLIKKYNKSIEGKVKKPEPTGEGVQKTPTVEETQLEETVIEVTAPPIVVEPAPAKAQPVTTTEVAKPAPTPKPKAPKRREGFNGIREILFSIPGVKVEGLTIDGNYYNVVITDDGRAKILVNVHGVSIPFYVTSGKGGKGLPDGWYPFFGFGPDGWYNKTDGDDMLEAYERYWGPEVANLIKDISAELNKEYGTDPNSFKDEVDPTSNEPAYRSQQIFGIKVRNAINRKMSVVGVPNDGDPAGFTKLSENIKNLGKAISIGKATTELELAKKKAEEQKAREEEAKRLKEEEAKKAQEAGKEKTDEEKQKAKEDLDKRRRDLAEKLKQKLGGYDASNKSSTRGLEDKADTKTKKDTILSAKRLARLLKSIFPDSDIVLHEDSDSYDEAMDRSDVKGGIGTAGNFSFYNNRVRIDINLELATPTVVAHEVAHAILFKTFGNNSALFKKFRNQVARLLTDPANSNLVVKDKAGNIVSLDKALSDFEALYGSSDVSAEEYLVQLAAMLSTNNERLSQAAPSLMKKIVDLINRIISTATGGKFSPFKDYDPNRDINNMGNFFNAVAGTLSINEEMSEKELKDSFDSLEKLARELNLVPEDLTSIATINKNAGFGSKSAVYDQLPGQKRTKKFSSVKTITPNDLPNEVVTTGSDRLTTGLVQLPSGLEVLFKGGIFYTSETGRVWAASTFSKAQELADKINQLIDKYGEAFMLPINMGVGSQTSNFSFFYTAMSNLRKEAERLDEKRENGTFKYKSEREKFRTALENGLKDAVKTLPNPFQKDYIPTAFGFDAKGNFLLSKKSSTEMIDSILEEFVPEKATFVGRDSFVNKFFGVTGTKSNPKWTSDLPKKSQENFLNTSKLVDLTSEPGSYGARIFTTSAAVGIKGKVRARLTTKEQDGEDFHNSYPAIIELVDGGEAQSYALDQVYNVEDLVPSFSKNDGEIVRWEDIANMPEVSDVKKIDSYFVKMSGQARSIPRIVPISKSSRVLSSVEEALTQESAEIKRDKNAIEEFTVGYAPFREGNITNLSEGEKAFENTKFKSWKKMSATFAEELGLSIIENNNTIGIYGATSDAAEASSVVSIKGDSNKIELFAALMGTMAPDIQHSVMSMNYADVGNVTENRITFKNRKGVLKFIEERDQYEANDLSFTPETNTVIILDFGDFNHAKFSKVYGKAVKEIYQKGASVRFVEEGEYPGIIQKARDSREGLDTGIIRTNYDSILELAQKRADRRSGDLLAQPEQKKKFLKDSVSNYLDKFAKTFGIEPITTVSPEKVKPSESTAMAIKQAYDNLKVDNSSDPDVKAAYEQLGKEVEEQYNYLINEVGLNIIFSENDPYDNSQHMMYDVYENNRLFVFKGGEPHSFLGDQTADENGITLNEKLRAVHDYFGHAVEGNQFGKSGEEAAWVAHSKMFSPLARRGLTTETRGQNSWVNNSPENEGALKKMREGNKMISEGNVLEGERLVEEGKSEFQFAVQKVDILPQEFVELGEYTSAPAESLLGTTQEEGPISKSSRVGSKKSFDPQNIDSIGEKDFYETSEYLLELIKDGIENANLEGKKYTKETFLQELIDFGINLDITDDGIKYLFNRSGLFNSPGLNNSYQRTVIRILSTESIPDSIKIAVESTTGQKRIITDEEVEAMADAILEDANMAETDEEAVTLLKEISEEMRESFTDKINRLEGGEGDVPVYELRVLRKIAEALKNMDMNKEAADQLKIIANIASIAGRTLREMSLNRSSDAMYIETLGRAYEEKRQEVLNEETYPGSGETNQKSIDSITEVINEVFSSSEELASTIAKKVALEEENRRLREENRRLRESQSTDDTTGTSKGKPSSEQVREEADQMAKYGLDLINGAKNWAKEFFGFGSKGKPEGGGPISKSSRLTPQEEIDFVKASKDFLLGSFYVTKGNILKAKAMYLKQKEFLYGHSKVDSYISELRDSGQLDAATRDIAKAKILEALSDDKNNNKSTTSMTAAQLIARRVKQMDKKNERLRPKKKTLEEKLNESDLDITTLTELRDAINADLMQLSEEKRSEILSRVEDLLLEFKSDRLNKRAAPWIKRAKIRKDFKDGLKSLGETVEDLIKDVTRVDSYTDFIGNEFIQRTGMTAEEAAPYIDIIKKEIAKVVDEKVAAKLEQELLKKFSGNRDTLTKNILDKESEIAELESEIARLEGKQKTPKEAETLKENKKKLSHTKRLLGKLRTRLRKYDESLEKKVRSKDFARILQAIKDGGLNEDTVVNALAGNLGIDVITRDQINHINYLSQKIKNAITSADQEAAIKEMKKYIYSLSNISVLETLSRMWESFMYANLLSSPRTAEVAFYSGLMNLFRDAVTNFTVGLISDIGSIFLKGRFDFRNMRTMLNILIDIFGKNRIFDMQTFFDVWKGAEGISIQQLDVSKKSQDRLERSLSEIDKVDAAIDKIKQDPNWKSSVKKRSQIIALQAFRFQQRMARLLVAADYAARSIAIPYAVRMTLTEQAIRTLPVDATYKQINEEVNRVIDREKTRQIARDKAFYEAANGRKIDVKKYERRIALETLPESVQKSVTDYVDRLAWTGRIHGYSGWMALKTSDAFDLMKPSPIMSYDSGWTKTGKVFRNIAATAIKMTTLTFPSVLFRGIQMIKNATPLGLIQRKVVLEDGKYVKKGFSFQFFKEFRTYNSARNVTEVIQASDWEVWSRMASGTIPSLIAWYLFQSMFVAKFDDEEEEEDYRDNMVMNSARLAKLLLTGEGSFEVNLEGTYLVTGDYDSTIAAIYRSKGIDYRPTTVYKKGDDGKYKAVSVIGNYKDAPYGMYFAGLAAAQERVLYSSEVRGGTKSTRDPLGTGEMFSIMAYSSVGFLSEFGLEGALSNLKAISDVFIGKQAEVEKLPGVGNKLLQNLTRQNLPLAGFSSWVNNLKGMYTDANKLKGVGIIDKSLAGVYGFKSNTTMYDFDALGRTLKYQESPYPFLGVLERGVASLANDQYSLMNSTVFEERMTAADELWSKYTDLSDLIYTSPPKDAVKTETTIVSLPSDKEVEDIRLLGATYKREMLENYYFDIQKIDEESGKAEYAKILRAVNNMGNSHSYCEYVLDILSRNSAQLRENALIDVEELRNEIMTIPKSGIGVIEKQEAVTRGKRKGELKYNDDGTPMMKPAYYNKTKLIEALYNSGIKIESDGTLKFNQDYIERYNGEEFEKYFEDNRDPYEEEGSDE